METQQSLMDVVKSFGSDKNIAELQEVSTDIKVNQEFRKKKDNTQYDQWITVIDGQRYRVPKSVLSDLKALTAKFPQMKKFTVSKTGEGMATKYTVVPLLA